MKVLITGAFGVIGQTVLNEFINNKHSVSVFEMENKRTAKISKKYKDKIDKIIWGNLCDKSSVAAAIEGHDVVVHLAAILPPLSEKKKDLAYDVNVGGTRNIIEAICEQGNKTKLVFTSSASVMGVTSDKAPPVKVSDPLQTTNNYSKTKIECEKILKESPVKYVVTRLGGVMNTQGSYDFKMLEEGFNMSLDCRIELVLDIDVATALNNAAELLVDGSEIDRKVFFVGGGASKNWQLTSREIQSKLYETYGLRLPKEHLFTKEPYSIDWLDTKESQYYLDYQNHSFDFFLSSIRQKFKYIIPLIILFRPIIVKVIENLSPYKTKQGALKKNTVYVNSC